jgi:hypothetical protein
LKFSRTKNGAEVLKNHKILERCKGKNVKLEKTLNNYALDSKIGVDKAANEPRKGSEILKNGFKNRKKSTKLPWNGQ